MRDGEITLFHKLVVRGALGALAVLMLSAASPYDDARYFTDSDSLRPTGGLTGEVIAELLPEERRAFCARTEYDVAGDLNTSPDGKIAFVNPEGFFGDVNRILGFKLFNVGLCWWHTRLQRSAAYLAKFFPERPRPSDAEARKLIGSLISMNAVVEIPGYSDFHDFTEVYQDRITASLSAWMGRDWVDGTGWAKRPFDTSAVSPGDLRGMMDALYDRLLGRPQLIFLRIHSNKDGALDSHALLLTGLQPLAEGGYRLTVIDSNDPAGIRTIDYRYGQPSMRYHAPGNRDLQIVPHVDFDGDLARIDSAVADHCRSR